MAQIEKIDETIVEKQNKPVKKRITSEEKRKYIGYTVIGIISLGLLLFAINDFGGDNKNKEVTEISTPESETNQYNSKVEAIQKGDKPISTSNNSLQDIYENDESNSESNNSNLETEKFEEEIRKMNTNNEKATTVSPTVQNKNSYSPVKKQQYPTTNIRRLETKKPEKENIRDDFGGFFSSDDNVKTSVAKSNIQESDPFFYGVIKGDHLGLKNKQRVALMLPKDALINGKLYKRNTVIYAIATFGSSRVNLTINNINQVPVNIKAYDAEDGGIGLQVRESLVSETSTEMVSDGADDLDLSGVPFGNTIKKILKKKNKEAKIDLLNNQKMILKIDK